LQISVVFAFGARKKNVTPITISRNYFTQAVYTGWHLGLTSSSGCV